MNTYANVAARPRDGSQGIDPTGDGIDPITTKLIHLWETKGATCQLEGDCVDVAGGGADRSTLTLGVVSGGDLHLSDAAASLATTSRYPTRRCEGREGEEASGVGKRGDEAEGGCWSHGLGEMIVRWLEDQAGLGEVIEFPFLPHARAGGGASQGQGQIDGERDRTAGWGW
jgi:hypothetical protein